MQEVESIFKQSACQTMTNSISFALDDWQEQHLHAAISQGWSLIETGDRGNSGIAIEYEIVTGDDPYCETLQLAISRMKAAYQNNEVHAIAAYKLLKKYSQSEFHYWGLEEW